MIPPGREPSRAPVVAWLIARAGSIRRSSILAGGSFVLATTAVNLSNFALHSVVSRTLGPGRYGALGSLLSVMVVLSVPLVALQATVSQRVVEGALIGKQVDIRSLTFRSGAIGVAVGAVWMACAVPLAGFLHFASPAPVLVVGLWVPPTVVGAVWSGALIAEGRFRALVWSQLLGAGAVRILATTALSLSPLGVAGGVLGSVAASLCTVWLMAGAIRQSWRPSDDGLSVRFGDGLRFVAAIGGATLLTSIDTWLARHYLPASSAGFFAAAATAGRIPLFGALAIIPVLFPRLAMDGASMSPGSGRRTSASVGLVSFAALVAGGAIFVESRAVTAVLFGAEYTGAVAALRVVVWADAVVAVITAMVYVHLARRSDWAALPWLGCVGVVVATALFHSSPVALGWDMVVVDLATLALISLAMLRSAPVHPAQHWKDRRSVATDDRSPSFIPPTAAGRPSGPSRIGGT